MGFISKTLETKRMATLCRWGEQGRRIWKTTSHFEDRSGGVVVQEMSGVEKAEQGVEPKRINVRKWIRNLIWEGILGALTPLHQRHTSETPMLIH